MASTSRTSGESFLRYQPPSTKLAFQSDKRYHVFLSFRGPDLRKTLVDHLFEALSVAGLNVFLDSHELEKGDIIDESLKRAIESSAIRIPIFSRGYADSTWCLGEAAEMLRTPALIIPLFYDVDPTQVRYPEKEKSPYCRAFQKHRSHSDRSEKEEIEQWKNALFEICRRSGWSMDITDGFEAQVIKSIVNDLIGTLKNVKNEPLAVAKHPVGLENVKNVLIHKLNDLNSDGVTKIGLWGIGGIGKTTVAKAVYNQIYANFNAASFVSDIRTTAAETSGLVKLQKKILRNLANYNKEVDSVDEGITLLRGCLEGSRVLLVLDDVDSVKQLNVLVGDWLTCGSTVIITSRDKHILNVGGIRDQCIHEMSGLGMEESLQLFSWHAFLRESPSLGYEDLSRKIVKACEGHPLSLEVIGSNLYDKKDDKYCWNEALRNMTTHNSEIYDILYISYCALSVEEKEIFVDIACFFIGEDKTLPIVFWESLYEKVHTAVSNLSMKLLIKIDDDGLFQMHDHLRDMGQTIAEKEKQGSRKWKPTHLSSLSDNLSRLRIIRGNPQSLEMLYTNGLHYLHLKNLTIECTSTDALCMLPRSLKWLRLENCKFEIVKNLTVEKPRHSRIADNIRQCKVLQLNGCFTLDSLSVSSPISLSVSPSPPITSIPLCMLLDNIGNLSQLQHLNLEECFTLTILPDSIGNLSQLQHLNLRGCHRLSSLPHSIRNLSQLQRLNLKGCHHLSSLPDSIGNLSQLQHLNLERCYSLSSLPDSIGNLSQLQDLNLGRCYSIRSLPDSIGNLSQLQDLNLGRCYRLSSLPHSIGNLSQLHKLNLEWCTSVSSLHDSNLIALATYASSRN